MNSGPGISALIARGYWWRHKATGATEQVGNVKRNGQDVYLYIPPKLRGPNMVSRVSLLAEWEPTGEWSPPGFERKKP